MRLTISILVWRPVVHFAAHYWRGQADKVKTIPSAGTSKEASPAKVLTV